MSTKQTKIHRTSSPSLDSMIPHFYSFVPFCSYCPSIPWLFKHRHHFQKTIMYYFLDTNVDSPLGRMNAAFFNATKSTLLAKLPAERYNSTHLCGLSQLGQLSIWSCLHIDACHVTSSKFTVPHSFHCTSQRVNTQKKVHNIWVVFFFSWAN